MYTNKIRERNIINNILLLSELCVFKKVLTSSRVSYHVDSLTLQPRLQFFSVFDATRETDLQTWPFFSFIHIMQINILIT